ncbi:UDP-3-O-(3-hydroxymyristoyl)glucosamine N-acyltransferase [Thiomicrospira sp. XS5]|uniref:UDP-3-O-(3-hydroxymyristoyl)glucosamine N-acyltransferase n=1 Tax=Thiomicrospira sp. XS5 TaxID=1775636 RepID=UPI0007487F07|nr:UDP-3-O-(3-hydroxymyristoyl)glucosamine N-acyltransferase [Thiomicrospira sp. XS5]KUJ75340.1 UDP-3-O-(3-hydroxymyristoyl)glucosamine N-acyltransferase [Thiomicrospira sp. XS5]
MKLQAILDHLAKQGVDVEFLGDSSHSIDQVSGLLEAEPSHISFLSDNKRITELEASLAGAIILKPEHRDMTSANRLLVKNPYYVYALTAQLLNPQKSAPGIHESAVIDASATIGQSVFIGPNVVIGPNAIIGDDVYIGAGTVIGADTIINHRGYLAPNVTIMHDCVIGEDVRLESGCVIGGEGFGFANEKGEWRHIPQIGRVVIGDRVYIGNNTTINRGTINDTVIESNCIIDCLVQIAHNVKVGYGTVIVSQVGIAGSTEIGKYCVLAGQTGVAGHVTIADKTHLGAKSGVTGYIKQAGSYSGFPAVPTSEWQKTMVRMKGLNKMAQKVKRLESELEEIKSQLENN